MAGTAPDERNAHGDAAATDGSAGTTGPGGAPWGELVAAALLGAERRRPPGGSVTALLDAAAAETVRRRAGALPAMPRRHVEPAPEDRRSPLPTAAERRLPPCWRTARRPERASRAGRRAARARPRPGRAASAVAGRSQRPGLPRPGGAAARAAGRGKGAYRSAGRDAGVRGAARAVAGTSELRLEVRAARRSTSSGDRTPPARRKRKKLWAEGLFAERVALLGALRRRAPEAGLALLAATWQTERAEDRLMFLDSLRQGLNGDGRAVLGAGAVRPQPHRAGDGGRTAGRAARFGAGGPDGGAGPQLCDARPAGRARHRGGSAARVRRGHAARRRHTQAAQRAGRTVLVAGPVGGGHAAGRLDRTAGRTAALPR